ncbi:MAG: hypothetical protein HOP11_06840 [Saprospiraceae bacterium]|nr:hypothetical protein [Saprospiraceae bacterium]
MVDSFTLLSLVRYIYNESSADEKQQLEETLQYDEEIKTEVRLLSDAKRLLPKVSFYPKDETVRKILSFSGKR